MAVAFPLLGMGIGQAVVLRSWRWAVSSGVAAAIITGLLWGSLNLDRLAKVSELEKAIAAAATMAATGAILGICQWFALPKRNSRSWQFVGVSAWGWLAAWACGGMLLQLAPRKFPEDGRIAMLTIAISLSIWAILTGRSLTEAVALPRRKDEIR